MQNTNKLIQLKEEQIFVEVELPKDLGPFEVNANDGMKIVDKGLDQIGDILKKVSNKLQKAFEGLNPAVEVKEAEVDLGFNFEAGGNIYIANTKTGTTLRVKLTIIPKT